MIARRHFISLLGGAAAAWPIAARAQEAKLLTVGVLSSATASAWAPFIAAFAQRLRELGWVEGRTVAIEYRYGEGHPKRFAEIADEFVRRKVDVIVTAGSAVPTIKRATTAIPIVFAMSGDAIASGLVASLSRPGGNVTGLSLQSTDVAGKRLELLREVVPAARRLAILANVGYPDAVSEAAVVQTTARGLGLKIIRLEIRRAEDIAPGFESLKGRADALYVAVDGLVATNTARIITLALSERLPTIFNQRRYVVDGGLMSYGPSFPHMFRRAAEIVDKILRGTKPGDIPVEQPTKFNLVINLITAKALGLAMPPMLLGRADGVIE